MSETPLRKSIQVAASRVGARLFRLNTGTGWVGRVVSRTADTITLADPRPLHAGLGVGGSDLLGWSPVVVTLDMVGKTIAAITAVEVKAGTTATTLEQRRFIAGVLAAGGRAGVARSVEDALRIISGEAS